LSDKLKSLVDTGPVRDFIKKQIKTKNAVLIDGPNILVNKRLDLKELAVSFQNVTFKRCYLTRDVPEGLVKAVENCGFSPILCFGNVHLYMAIDTIDLCHNKEINSIVFVSRASDLAPVIRSVRDRGIKAIVVGFDPGMSVALKNAASKVVMVNP